MFTTSTASRTRRTCGSRGASLLGKGLFAFAGWDDPTFSDRSSVLFGAGYTWIDEDIKYYAGTAAIAAP
jgi:hypothetical protein